jgi:flap endonuclease-1
MQLPGGRFAIDAYGLLFRYLCSYRSQRGDLFRKNGQVVSHLMGLSRLLPHLRKGREVFLVFDGMAPALKHEVQKIRRQAREASLRQYEGLKRMAGETDRLRRLAARTTRLQPQFLKSAADFALSLGCHVIFAAGEAEPVMAHLKREDIVDQLLTQDSDIGLYRGVERYFRGVSVKGAEVVGYCWNVAKGLEQAGLTIENLVEAAILAGTDYWRGLPSVGPKTALKRVREGVKHPQEYLAKIEAIRQIFVADVTYTMLRGAYDPQKVLAHVEAIWSSPVELKKVLDAVASLDRQGSS